ncbi:MAG: pre-peptidase C-terminal domain-containing protein, partial [Chloroflexota bacterium]
IAGIGALIMALHPTWMPSEIKSAIMTSARDTVSSAGDPFSQGAGFVNPKVAADPGLVYPTTPTEYRQYLVGLGVHFAPPNDTLTPISGPDLNQASIAIGSVPGTQTVTRHVKNVGAAGTYRVTASVPGFVVTVTPATLTLAAGQQATFTVTFARGDAAFGAWAKGSLIWTDGSHRVRSPIALRPVPVAAPAEVHGAASASGSTQFQVTPGFTGNLSTTVSGLVGVTPVADSVTVGAFDATAPVADADTKVYHVEVPAGTRAARFSLDAVNDSDDLDLYVYKAGTLVDLSASGSADEQVTLVDPAAGTYDVYVNGFAGTGAYAISNFVVPTAAAGNATVTPNPASVTQGTPATLHANWTGLDPAKRWFGIINYTGTDTFTFFSVG